MYGERLRGGCRAKILGNTVGRGTHSLYPESRSKDMGVEVSRMQISFRERARCLALGLLDVRSLERMWAQELGMLV